MYRAMSRKFSFLGMLGVIVVIGAAGSFLLDALRPTGLLAVTFLEDTHPEPQQPENRILRSLQRTQLFSLPVGEDEPLTIPGNARIASEGEIFVLDLADRAVEVFDQAGTHLRTIAGPGQAETPLLTPTDFSLGSADDLWVTDNGPGKIVRFDRDGRSLDATKYPVGPYRIALFPDESFALMGFGQGSELIYLYDPSGEPLGRFGVLIEEQKLARIALDGWIEPAGADTLVFAGTYTSVIAKFSKEGELLFLRRPVAPNPDSSVEILESRKIHMEDGSPWSALSLSVEGSRFYVLTMAEKDGSRRTYLDAYALDDGGYLHSYELPPRCTTAEIRGSQLLTITPEEMTLWHLEESGGDPA